MADTTTTGTTTATGTTPPWPAPTTSAVSRTPCSGGALVAMATLIGTGVALAVGIGTAVVVALLANTSCSSSSDPWCGLGALLVGLAVGFAAMIVSYITAGIAYITRRRPRGERAPFVVIHLAIGPVLLIAASVLVGMW